jgi:CRP/FNR family cyclic AMP-dependent transcriptional regulator
MSIFASWEASRLHSQHWQSRADLGERVAILAGRVIFSEQAKHRYFYLIRSGYVQVTISRSSGNPLLLEIYGPGTIFGEGAAFEGAPRVVTTRTVSDCALTRYDPEAMKMAFVQDIELALSLVRLMSAKQRSLASKVASLSSSAPEARLCDLMLRVGHAEARQRTDGQHLQVHLTHEQLASMSGLSRVTVTRTLSRLSQLGLVETLPGIITLLQPAQISDRAAQT